MTDRPKVNPYNFVPLENPPLRGDYPGIDRLAAGRYSGVLECELEVLTALFTADHRSPGKEEQEEDPGQHEETKKDKQKERKLLHFLHDHQTPDRRPILQGTSLRGMVRSIYEAATNSCLPLAALSRSKKKSSHEYHYGELGEHQACTSPTKLCPACQLFGMIHGEELHVQGRVTFSDAVLSEGELHKELKGLAELSTPKPHHSGIYGVRGGSGQAIAGRKLYYHHKATFDERRPPSDRANDIAEHARKGTRFRFAASFRNLSLEELATLHHCLVLDEGLAHKFGMAKPLGFGSCKITVIDSECAVYKGGSRYVRWQASPMQLAVLDLKAERFPDSLREILRLEKHQGQPVGYLSWREYKSARIDRNGHYESMHHEPQRKDQSATAATPLAAELGQSALKKKEKSRPKIEAGQKIKVVVTADEDGEYVLRVKDTGQEGIRLRPGTRWEVGQTVRVRVVKVDSDGRVQEVAT